MHTTSKSQTTTSSNRRGMPTEKKIPATHPGTILREEFLDPLGLSQSKLARRLNVDKRRVNEVVHGQRAVTADTALRLAAFFGTSPGFWLNLQKQYELDVAQDDEERIRKEVKPYAEG